MTTVACHRMIPSQERAACCSSAPAFLGQPYTVQDGRVGRGKSLLDPWFPPACVYVSTPNKIDEFGDSKPTSLCESFE